MPEIILKSDYYKYHEFQLSYSTGLLIQLKTNRKTDFTIGLQFTNVLSKGKEWTYAPYALTPSKNFYYLDTLISKIQIGRASRFVEMPLLLNFRLAGKKIKFTINPGLTISYFLNYKSTSRVVFKDGHIENSSNVDSKVYGSRFCFFPQLSLGLEKEVMDDFYLKIEPTIKPERSWDFFDSNYLENLIFGINFTLVKQLY
ncbi:MAG: hypothetical protein KA285_02955 [Bacteroidia bacterium]|nr:hypothetical protein [Bacteroidia bacterium]